MDFTDKSFLPGWHLGGNGESGRSPKSKVSEDVCDCNACAAIP